MVYLSVSNNLIACSQQNLLKVFTHDSCLLTHQLSSNNNAEEETAYIAHAFSKDNSRFVAIASNKKILVWDTSNFESSPIERVVQKRPTCVTFCNTNTNVVVVGDKTGDVFRLDLTTEEVPQDPLLGHLSMVLDVKMTSDDKYVITADRDEKIRVSAFPLSYIISSWCLGHTQLVSSLCMMSEQSAGNRLLSSAGDSTIRLWNYVTGSEEAVCNVYEECGKQNVAVNNELDEEGCVISHVAEMSGYICASVEQCNHLFFFKLVNNQFTALPAVNIHCQPQRICFTMDGVALIAATGKGVKTVVKKDDGTFQLSEEGNSIAHRVARQVAECEGLQQSIDAEEKAACYFTDLLKPGKRNRPIEMITPEATINFKPPIKLLKREGKLQEQTNNGMEE